ncbi:MAG TPA: T9SS type A sorting domain-containing protein, partial [bacterium (Candidatus Stahlbacteria)]|nr:T9SS type A sorting domain-containing protein [Candidatus Stahlbacteria bacterium]
ALPLLAATVTFSQVEVIDTRFGLLKTTTSTSASHKVQIGTTHYYYATAFDDAGKESAGSDTIRVDAILEGASPCVFTWDGSDFIGDNSILPASQMVPGVVVDYYKIETLFKEKDRKYFLEIRELGDKLTYLDQLRLLAVEHSEEMGIQTTPNGQIISYREMSLPITCIDNYGNDRLELVKSVGDVFFEGNDGDWLVVDFGEVNWEKRAVMVGIGPSMGGFAAHVQIWEENEWEDAGVIYPRAKSSTQLVDLSDYDFEGELRLYCEGKARIDYVALVKQEEQEIRIKECPLVSAIHSTNGSVRQELLIVDENYVELVPGDTIALAFTAVGGCHNHIRDFVLVSTGYYVEIGSDGTQSADADVILPMKSDLLSTSPNPFVSSISIRYAVAKNTWVRLDIYDINGRLAKTLINTNLDVGYHTLSWYGKDTKGGTLPSGIYFVRLKAGEYIETRKVVLVR